MSRSDALHPNQASLVERLVAPEQVRIALVAPTGTGKTRAVMVAIDQLVRHEPSTTTVLIVAPSAVGGYIASKLRELEVPTRIQSLRGADLRLQDPEKATLEPGVYLVSSELTLRPWARDVLVSLPWSLVFIDEAHYGGAGTDELIAQLSRSETTHRLCAASATGWIRSSSALDLVTWDIEVAQRPTRRVVQIRYERSSEELQIRERLAVIEAKFGAAGPIRTAIEAAWRSSASAFEYVLARQAGSLLTIDPDAKDRADPIIRERQENAVGGSERLGWSDPAGAAIALQHLLRDFGKLSQDSKLQAFLDYRGTRARGGTLVVFTVMRQTAIYLHAALSSQGVTAAVIDGSRAPEDRVAPADAQVVIVTDAVLPAIDTLNAGEGVSYDLPWNPQRIEARWTSLHASGGETVMAIFDDAADTDHVERVLARKHALISDLLDPR